MLLRGFCSGFIVGASAFEEVYEAVVPLVTGVLEDRPIKPADGYFPRPGSRPRRGVLDREFVTDPVCIDASEALDHMQRVAGQDVLSSVPRGPSEIGLVGEVGRVDDQRVAFPVTARITRQ